MAIRAMPWRQHCEKKKFKTTPLEIDIEVEGNHR
jgi:hypothetical protein